MMLAGKRVLVTGGGSGVGADLARGFARAGAEVVIAGRRIEALQAVASDADGIRAVAGDVTDETAVAGLFDTAGPCDIVIANAGAAESMAFGKMTLDHWNAMLAVNLTGTFLTFREGLRRMPGAGRLIAVASVAGLKGYPYVAAYAAAKHGVVGLVRALGEEVAGRGITVNAICPGYLDTEMTARTLANIGAKTGRSVEDARAALERQSPQRRLFEPGEVTGTALWLCSDAARGINGQAIAIAGGAP
ncbi:MAG: SDR family oxidoreductase [Rhodobacteraceae bacterium]|jgi:3-hydroxybutyrate dehydrogenase|nr:SDR family oxidoreductase [Paracoccaceae bacterium]